MNIKNVISLFDGMSCFQIALKELRITPNIYYASEVDKHAIAQTQLNFPNTIQLGSVTEIDVSKLEPIDIICGGSPCQSFSFAGKRKGMATKCETEILTIEHYLELKDQKFEFEGQSYLFWEYMRILTEIRKYNPDVLFILENVEMGEKWERVLRQAIGVKALHINSALVSAQNRKRIYFTNIGMKPMGLFGELESIIPQPKDEGNLLKDILEDEVDEKYFLSEKMINWLTRHSEKRQSEFKKLDGSQKASCLTTTEAKQNLSNDYIIHNMMPRSSTSGKGGTGHLSRNDGKTYCLDTGNTNAVEIIVASRGGRFEGDEQHIEPRYDGKTNCLTSVQKDNLVMCTSGLQANATTYLNKSTPMTAAMGMGGGHTPIIQGKSIPSIRRLTVRECARLQTVPDWYIWKCSNTQQYKMLGNGFTIKVIQHLLSFI